MNVERLTKLIESLKQSPQIPLDMGSWVRWDSQGCVTAGCAAGIYVTMNPKCGLHLYPTKFSTMIVETESGLLNNQALSAHFDITLEQCWRIFAESAYVNPTKEHVIQRIARRISFSRRSQGEC